ncbi:MAG: hypothetical protein B7Z66_04305 [Chromatiales bacterium 21-64-14]|nr:MAG: hypothetical protein B7Z66_04305 [Chromatiales bacterium 21-64-14]
MVGTGKPALEERRESGRRRRRDRRTEAYPVPGARIPGWPEQCIQFVTRYLFVGLGLLFFSGITDVAPTWLSSSQLDGVFAVYTLITTAAFLHARSVPYSPVRYRIAMWVDVLMVTTAVLNDPHDIPPSVLVYIMVVLGNGMRYGMRLFAEAVVGCFAGAMVAFSLRHTGSLGNLDSGVVFLNLFGAIILVYAYILMSRIESSRQLLEAHSRRDNLTGLLNRRALEEDAGRLFERVKRGGQRLVVMFADLDNFKSVNDTLGHSAGDQVLVQFAAIVSQSIRRSDMGARYGGDEFVLVFPDISLADADRIAHRIRSAFATWTAQQHIDCNATIGIGEAPAHGSDLAAMLDSVDRAMYAAKSGGGGGVRHVAAPGGPVSHAGLVQ